eukprot:RCo019524
MGCSPRHRCPSPPPPVSSVPHPTPPPITTMLSTDTLFSHPTSPPSAVRPGSSELHGGHQVLHHLWTYGAEMFPPCVAKALSLSGDPGFGKPPPSSSHGATAHSDPPVG